MGAYLKRVVVVELLSLGLIILTMYEPPTLRKQQRL
jgi:hypothetical protein